MMPVASAARVLMNLLLVLDTRATVRRAMRTYLELAKTWMVAKVTRVETALVSMLYHPYRGTRVSVRQDSKIKQVLVWT